MRLLLSLIFFSLSGWQTFTDWQATMGQGNAFRFSSVEEAWISLSAETHAEYLPILQQSTVPMLWDPVLINLITFPAAVVLFVLSALFWMVRKRKEVKKMNYVE